MKVCDAIPGTLYVVSEENAAISENNRFTERFNFELAFNLPLSELFLKSISIGNWRDGPCNAIFNHGNVVFFFAELGLNSTSCGLLKIGCPEIFFVVSPGRQIFAVFLHWNTRSILESLYENLASEY